MARGRWSRGCNAVTAAANACHIGSGSSSGSGSGATGSGGAGISSLHIEVRNTPAMMNSTLSAAATVAAATGGSRSSTPVVTNVAAANAALAALSALASSGSPADGSNSRPAPTVFSLNNNSANASILANMGGSSGSLPVPAVSLINNPTAHSISSSNSNAVASARSRSSSTASTGSTASDTAAATAAAAAAALQLPVTANGPASRRDSASGAPGGCNGVTGGPSILSATPLGAHSIARESRKVALQPEYSKVAWNRHVMELEQADKRRIADLQFGVTDSTASADGAAGAASAANTARGPGTARGPADADAGKDGQDGGDGAGADSSADFGGPAAPSTAAPVPAELSAAAAVASGAVSGITGPRVAPAGVSAEMFAAAEAQLTPYARSKLPVEHALWPRTGTGEVVIPWSVVAQHNIKADSWMVLDNIVYDITAYIAFHPGGQIGIVNFSGDNRGHAPAGHPQGQHEGRDATEAFNRYHKYLDHRKMLGPYKLGVIAPSKPCPSAGAPSGGSGSSASKANTAPAPGATGGAGNSGGGAGGGGAGGRPPTLFPPESVLWPMVPTTERESGFEPVIPWSEIRKHNIRADGWMVLDDIVYDITAYIPSHPGGQIGIVNFCGENGGVAPNKDHPQGEHKGSSATESFNFYHKYLPHQKMMKQYRIGVAEKRTPEQEAAAAEEIRLRKEKLLSSKSSSSSSSSKSSSSSSSRSGSSHSGSHGGSGHSSGHSSSSSSSKHSSHSHSHK